MPGEHFLLQAVRDIRSSKWYWILAKISMNEKEPQVETPKMGEGQATMLAVRKVYRSVLSNPTSTSLKLTILFFSSCRALDT